MPREGGNFSFSQLHQFVSPKAMGVICHVPPSLPLPPVVQEWELRWLSWPPGSRDHPSSQEALKAFLLTPAATHSGLSCFKMVTAGFHSHLPLKSSFPTTLVMLCIFAQKRSHPKSLLCWLVWMSHPAFKTLSQDLQ